jgi:hypothetical protein
MAKFSRRSSHGVIRVDHTASLGAALLLAGVAAACGGSGSTPRPVDVQEPTESASQAVTAPTTPTTTPIGLAIEVENGAGTPLSVRAGQTFYLNQIDLRTFVNTTVDEGLKSLETTGDWASLDWSGVEEVDEAPILLQNGDGTWQRRRFYRYAKWMNVESHFTLEQVDGAGKLTAAPISVSGGREFHPRDSDDYWDRRYRAIQWTYDCVTQSDCTGATSFQEEALVELRYAQHPEKTFVIQPNTTALRLRWSAKRGETYTIPLTQVASPPYDYGFSIDIQPLTPPNADGTYSPGSDITFQATLRDGSGNRLHPPGSLPTYNDVIFGSDPAGIQYYRAFFDPTMTYYRRKHRERNMMVEFEGPAQNVQPIRHLAPLSEFLVGGDVQNIADFADDGVYAQFKLFPTAVDLFGGAFDPAHAAWNNPVSDTWTNHVPSDAVPGTYFATMKGRRVYLGQDIPFTKTVEVQVGTTQHTQAQLNTGGCDKCHSGQSGFDKILHANSDRTTCAACHAPLGFEYEGPIYTRVHFIHSRTTRFDADVEKCANCHQNVEGIQRTSQSACISCHKSYDAWHVKQYGPISYMYTGGSPTQFQQCTSTCHTNHPDSGL